MRDPGSNGSRTDPARIDPGRRKARAATLSGSGPGNLGSWHGYNLLLCPGSVPPGIFVPDLAACPLPRSAWPALIWISCPLAGDRGPMIQICGIISMGYRSRSKERERFCLTGSGVSDRLRRSEPRERGTLSPGSTDPTGGVSRRVGHVPGPLPRLCSPGATVPDKRPPPDRMSGGLHSSGR